ncbi:hypothetical protein ACSBR1_031570 [Camellia fascicularis]
MNNYGSSGNRNGKKKIGMRSPQTSTKLASKRQSKLPFKKQKGPGDPVRKADVNPPKLMYRSNISGLISTVLELELRDGHIRQLQKTPFRVMIDAIRVHELDPKLFKKCDATVCRIIQTYNPEDEKFHIGGAKLPLHNNDIRLIFGVQCGKEKLDLTQGGKGPFDFMQRRCANVSRISSKVIKDLLAEAICGRAERDEEDVAKLLCLYVCAKLFFATTGEHISWAFVRVIDKLDTLRHYDWTATIRNTLIGSLNEMHNRPEKVTGCVVALLFLICEHSNIVTPERSNVTPRFCRWNIGAVVGKLRVLNLSAEGCIEVQCGKLVGTITECHVLKVVAAAIELKECGRIRMDMDSAEVCDGCRAVIETDDVGSVEPSFNCWQPDTKNGDSLDDLEVHEVTQFVVNDGSNQRTPSNSLSGKVSGSGNVTSGESAQQSACPAGQPEDVGISELEIVENETGIKDLTVDFAHGNVRTTVQGVEGSCNPQNAQTVSGGNVKDGAAVVGVEGRCEHTAAATSSGPKITSLVKRVKNKARREFRLSDYEYPGIFGRPQVNANVRLGKSFEPGVIYSVDDVEVECKTWNGFGMNRRHTMWNMLKDIDRQLLQRMYSLEGDRMVDTMEYKCISRTLKIWCSRTPSTAISEHCFLCEMGDVAVTKWQLNLTTHSHEYVIDAYAAMLTEMHKMVSGRPEYVGTSYIYTSVCSDMMRNSSVVSRTKYLNVHMKAARGCRYTLFPIYNANHWTVMAHDSDSGNWKHYNSMRPRRGVRDEHYNEALKVISTKQLVADHHNKFVKPRVTAEGATPDLFDGTFVSVVDCPQQVLELQYIRGAEVNTMMDGLTPTGLRAAMVDMFLSDPGRGLRGRTL